MIQKHGGMILNIILANFQEEKGNAGVVKEEECKILYMVKMKGENIKWFTLKNIYIIAK